MNLIFAFSMKIPLDVSHTPSVIFIESKKFFLSIGFMKLISNQLHKRWMLNTPLDNQKNKVYLYYIYRYTFYI